MHSGSDISRFLRILLTIPAIDLKSIGIGFFQILVTGIRSQQMQ
jgi:hypothetical protein